MEDIINQVDHCKDLGIIMQDDAAFALQIEKSVQESKTEVWMDT